MPVSRRRPRSTAWQTGPCRGAPRGGLRRRARPGFRSALSQSVVRGRTLLESRLPHEPREASNFLSYSGEPQGHHGMGASSRQARGRALGRPQPFQPLSPFVHGGSRRLRLALAQRAGSVQGLRARVQASWGRPAAHRWALSDHVLALTWGAHSSGHYGVTAWCPEGP